MSFNAISKSFKGGGKVSKMKGGGRRGFVCLLIHIFSVHFENTISKSYIKVSIDIKHC